MNQLTVGFDLDMTLIDSRPGIAAVLDALSAETGVWIDSAAATARLGPPLEHELALWFPPGQVSSAADRYRELYPGLAIEATRLLRGAREAVAAVRRHGGRVLVVTAKYAPSAELHLSHLGVVVDEVIGWHWGPAKGDALRERGAAVYVGDHAADVRGARAAGAVAVGVPTGPVDAAALERAGADAVLPDLAAFPDWLDRHVRDGVFDADLLLDARIAALEERLRELGSTLVAFSGGADSAFLLAAAVRALGPDAVVAATGRSASLAAGELAPAREFARSLGVRHLEPRTREDEREGYRANGADRCAFCKSELLDVLTPLARGEGLAAVVTGTNADDVRAGFRPGIGAAAARGARTPLSDAALTKAQVRAASRRWGLPTWDKPAAACLSSRVAYGVRITPSRLARVDRAEAALRVALAAEGLDVRDLRVRDIGGEPPSARIEVDRTIADRVAAAPRLLEAVRGAGFATVEVDPRGFRSGSMNEALTAER